VDNGDSPLAGTEVHYLASKTVGDEFKIFVGHCPGGDDDRAQPPAVLYVTDANGMFGTAVDIVRLMQMVRHLPPLLVVGIGYRLGSLGETAEIRARDLTPSDDRHFAAPYETPPKMGGADAFLGFIRTELMPWVANRYDIDPADTTYFGDSLGGLFGTYVLLSQPDAFRRYAIGSPSLWWRSYATFKQEAAYAETHDDLCAKVFFGIGGDETQEGRMREASRQPETEREMAAAIPLDMVADMTRFVDTLQARRYPSLELESSVFPGEFHATVPSVNLSRGLRYLFDAP
jgi:predicted alpha/beta superfamily hydrolase